jgi:hypothetical protein
MKKVRFTEEQMVAILRRGFRGSLYYMKLLKSKASALYACFINPNNTAVPRMPRI